MKKLISNKIFILVIAIILIIVCMIQVKCAPRISHVTCANHIGQIGLALRMYAEDNNGFFPNKPGRVGFEMLRSGGYLECVTNYTCPESDDNIRDGADLSSSSVSYMYVPGMKLSDPPNTLLARDKEFRHVSYTTFFIHIRFTQIMTHVNFFPVKYGNVLYIDSDIKGVRVKKVREPEWSEIISKNNFTY